jgi:hypothetical protein
MSWLATRGLSKYSECDQVSPVDQRTSKATEPGALSCSMSDLTHTSTMVLHLHCTHTSSQHGANLGQKTAFNIYHRLGSRICRLGRNVARSVIIKSLHRLGLSCWVHRPDGTHIRRPEIGMREYLLPTQTTRNKINSEIEYADRSLYV